MRFITSDLFSIYTICVWALFSNHPAVSKAQNSPSKGAYYSWITVVVTIRIGTLCKRPTLFLSFKQTTRGVPLGRRGRNGKRKVAEVSDRDSWLPQYTIPHVLHDPSNRQIAALCYHNYIQGRNKAVWFSCSGDLINDASRDFQDIGASKIPLANLDKVLQGLQYFHSFRFLVSQRSRLTH